MRRVDDALGEVVEAGPAHAGVLTSPAYLLRFQTHRARANRFHVSFLCQPFVAPDGGLPATPGAVTLEMLRDVLTEVRLYAPAPPRAGAETPAPMPSPMPQAIAMMFFSTPPI